MNAGLYHNLHRLTVRLASSQPVETDPRVAHANVVSRDQLRADRDDVAATILEDEKFHDELQSLLNRMVGSAHGSARRTLAIRRLEEAQDQIRRELGDKPEACGWTGFGSAKPDAPRGTVKAPAFRFPENQGSNSETRDREDND